jgi:hypothetical protein
VFYLFKQFFKEILCSKTYYALIKYNRINKNYTIKDNTQRYKMYVLIVRERLTLIQCGVQAGHAIAEFMMLHSHIPVVEKWCNRHKYMVFLEASENEIRNMIETFYINGKKSKAFYEGDLGNLMTACAFEPVTSEEGKKFFSNFKLLK